MATPEVEELLIGLILEGKVEGRIDQVGMRLELDRKQNLEKQRYNALERWTRTLENVHAAVVAKTSSGQGRQGGQDPTAGFGGLDPYMIQDRWGGTGF